MNIKQLIELCNTQQGKVLVVDEAGEVKLVIMAPKDFAVLSSGTVAATEPTIDPEQVNQEILNAQLHEEILPPAPAPSTPSHISTTLSKKAKQLFRSVPADLPLAPTPHGLDLRSEVIDPSFDFDAPVPGMEEI